MGSREVRAVVEDVDEDEVFLLRLWNHLACSCPFTGRSKNTRVAIPEAFGAPWDPYYAIVESEGFEE